MRPVPRADERMNHNFPIVFIFTIGVLLITFLVGMLIPIMIRARNYGPPTKDYSDVIMRDDIKSTDTTKVLECCGIKVKKPTNRTPLGWGCPVKYDCCTTWKTRDGNSWAPYTECKEVSCSDLEDKPKGAKKENQK